MKAVRWLLPVGICAVLLCTAGFSSYKIYGILQGYSTARHTYEDIRESYVDYDASASSEKISEGTNKDVPTENSSLRDSSPLKIDFEDLRRNLNPEVIGWIWCEDTVINYPIAQHSDNEYYLNYSISGEQNASGAIYLETANFSDFRDTNNILHGHHMGDGSMFASLDRWQAKDYLEAHPVMYLNTPNGNYRIDIFAGFTTPANSKAYQYEFISRSDIQSWIDWVRTESVINPDLKLSPDDRFLTLSTCAYSYEDARTVLIGRLEPVG